MQSPGKVVAGDFCDTWSKAHKRIPEEPNENIGSLRVYSLLG